MKTNKSFDQTKILIVVVTILILAFLAWIIVRANKNTNSTETGLNNKLENLPVKEARAQSYVATKVPTFKADDKIIGDKDAKLKIFVYEDAASLYSAKLADTLDELYSSLPAQLAIIIRPFVSENSDISKEAALAVECAGDSGKWVSMRALLFAQAKNNSLNLVDFNKYANQLGLDEKAFSTCLTNQAKSAKIEGLMSEAESYNVNGAPTIFVSDEMILGARPYEDYVDSNGDSIEGLKTLIEKKIK
jgi:protein-disulfide isomerase